MCVIFPYPPEKYYALDYVKNEYLLNLDYPSHYQGCGYNKYDENPSDERQE